jgi:UDP-N-acetylglucosamine enolpyruvyl transferase
LHFQIGSTGAATARGSDLRASAALVLAGLAAEGVTRVEVGAVQLESQFTHKLETARTYQV